MTKSVAQDKIGFAFIFNLESYKLQKYFSFVKYAATDFHNIPFCIMHRETLNDALQNVHLRAVRVFSALNHFPQFENIGSCCRCGKKEMCRQQKVKGAATGVDNPRLGLQMSSPHHGGPISNFNRIQVLVQQHLELFLQVALLVVSSTNGDLRQRFAIWNENWKQSVSCSEPNQQLTWKISYLNFPSKNCF